MEKINQKPQYTFEDWKKDHQPYQSIPSSFYDIPKEELEKIHKEQERLFWERVEVMTERYKAEYQGKANTSGDLDRLKKDEIEALTNLFYPDKVKAPILQNGEPNLIKGKRAIWGIGQINGSGLRRLRDAYQTWVINGKRDYTYVKYNNRFNTFNDVPVAVIALKRYYDWLQTSISVNLQSTINESTPTHYKADEYALTYILDLYANEKELPANRVDGGLDAKKIKEDSVRFPTFKKKPDTFYRAVLKVVTYNLSSEVFLTQISKDWYNAVKDLSSNWVTTYQYLKDKNLTKD